MTTTPEPYERARQALRQAPRRWLITGVAGFIGSHLLQALLALDQSVVGLDNYATGHAANLQAVRAAVGEARWANFRLIEGDIRDAATCRAACEGADFVLHEAALGSVPRSLADPATSNAVNVSGFLNMLIAARDAGVQRFVYAASSSTYGDDERLPKVEQRIGAPLSPYAVTKYVNELYASVFARSYGIRTVGLRYFNVFGPRQDPRGAYAAVVPCWAEAMLAGEPVYINGDGHTSRDFCFVDNVVQANLLAALADERVPPDAVFNVAVGERTSLNELHALLQRALQACRPQLAIGAARHRAARAGDVLHSLADISQVAAGLGYQPTHTVRDGLGIVARWFADRAPAGG